MDKTIFAFGEKVIVNRDKKTNDAGFIMIDEKEIYVSGEVISFGSGKEGGHLDDIFGLEVGCIVVYPASRANPLGLGFPDTYDVVEAGDIVGEISDEDEDEDLSWKDDDEE
jgi:hypothetical protein